MNNPCVFNIRRGLRLRRLCRSPPSPPSLSGTQRIKRAKIDVFGLFFAVIPPLQAHFLIYFKAYGDIAESVAQQIG